ncbi:odorant receptor 46a-like isoform X2 [Vespula pensylvanica]|uniref:odorant receptor 46a-like isoform X2 n=1 Tax=Vespula pensylvanica TaxID=30213 RepID=UPI001CBA02A9|nr:odorant receptor 46a-like isoform X2 [Vespula pensylvanica]
MTILASTLMILSICGCWRPPSWSFSYYKRVIYNLYNICVIFLVSSLSLSQIIGIALNISSDLSEEIYISLTIAVSCLKMLTFKFNHNDVVKLINTLAEEPYKPSDNEEIQIQLKFEKLARLNTNGYTSLIGFSVSSFVFMSLITDLKEKQLTFQVWLPFDSTTPVIYYLTYTQQMLGMTLAGFLNVALDSLICGIFIHICCQIKILENRLMKISNEQEALLKLCVRHHECIYKFADNVNKTFGLIMFIQFFGSTMTVSFTLYQLTKISSTSVEYAKMSLYMYCMLIQIYLYCWYGNLITLKSREIINNIFDINWTRLDNSIKTSLLIMMNRTMNPISLVVMKIFSLNLDSFISIIKTAYSAYNLLQQTQE